MGTLADATQRREHLNSRCYGCRCLSCARGTLPLQRSATCMNGQFERPATYGTLRFAVCAAKGDGRIRMHASIAPCLPRERLHPEREALELVKLTVAVLERGPCGRRAQRELLIFLPTVRASRTVGQSRRRRCCGRAGGYLPGVHVRGMGLCHGFSMSSPTATLCGVSRCLTSALSPLEPGGYRQPVRPPDCAADPLHLRYRPRARATPPSTDHGAWAQLAQPPNPMCSRASLERATSLTRPN